MQIERIMLIKGISPHPSEKIVRPEVLLPDWSKCRISAHPHGSSIQLFHPKGVRGKPRV